jgi:excisionase family DNA binding protein
MGYVDINAVVDSTLRIVCRFAHTRGVKRREQFSAEILASHTGRNQIRGTKLPDEALKLLTIPETADILGSHPATVRRMIHAGQLPAIRVRGHYRIAHLDLESWLAAGGSGTRKPCGPKRREIGSSATPPAA